VLSLRSDSYLSGSPVRPGAASARSAGSAGRFSWQVQLAAGGHAPSGAGAAPVPALGLGLAGPLTLTTASAVSVVVLALVTWLVRGEDGWLLLEVVGLAVGLGVGLRVGAGLAIGLVREGVGLGVGLGLGDGLGPGLVSPRAMVEVGGQSGEGDVSACRRCPEPGVGPMGSPEPLSPDWCPLPFPLCVWLGPVN